MSTSNSPMDGPEGTFSPKAADSGAHSGGISSAWIPLRQELFRALWIASVASNLGTWIHEVGAAWLMTSLAPSPLMVSLIQTAEMLPVFLVALFAGALADVVDRRRLLLFAQSWMLGAAATLGILTVVHATTATSLLVFTFLLSLGGALNGPAWQAIVPELVPRSDVPAAVALSSVGFNVARAVGPAVGGLIVALASPGAAFLLNAVSFMAVIVVLYRWHRPPKESMLPAERVVGAMVAGIRYVRHEPSLRFILVRVILFVIGTSALWSLIPLYARQDLGLGATGYGVLLGCMGAGAVAGGTALPYLRHRFATSQLLGAGTMLFASAMAGMGLWHYSVVAALAMAAAGSAWTTILSIFTTSVQLGVPGWVRGRALAVLQLVFAGVMALGSAMWGAIALRTGIPLALVASGVVIAAGLLAAFRYHVVSGEELDLATFSRPAPVVAAEPHPDRGPVLVTVEYRIDPKRSAQFAGAMRELGRMRRRDGALRWGLFEDVADPGRYVENFIVESWAEHLRQHERATVADREAEQRVRHFHIGEKPPAVAHYLYSYDERLRQPRAAYRGLLGK